uniref:Sulfatase N-terminal domain-containing protein n=1 Tax=Romanomermis culicivorax TaxID=13658 RepID=A0A915KI21_ROMCU
CRFLAIFLTLGLFVALSIVYNGLDVKYYFYKICSDNSRPHEKIRLDQSSFDDAIAPEIDGLCSFPKFHPHSPEIEEFIGTTQKAVFCRKVQPYLTYVSSDGVIIFNQTELKALNNKSLSCSYAYFDRGGTDRDIILEKEILLNPYETRSIQIKKPFMVISCFKFRNELFYRNIHSIPILPLLNNNLSDGEKMNVLIFTLESTSREMFHRSLPSTLHYLQNELESVEFTKFSKVAENTFPNIVPLFTGLRARNEEHWWKSMKPEIKNDKAGFYDHLPFIWKIFKNAGYATSFVEDMTQIGTFQYSGKGFKNKPVDLWHFPFWEMIRKSKLPMKSGQFCFGNQPIHKIFLELVQNLCLSTANQSIPFFSFNIFSELSHDFTNDLSRIDQDLTIFLKNIRGSLNSTIFFLLGDHGPRFSDLRPTFQGYVEERHPVLFVTLPRWFRNKYLRVEDSLKRNADKMVTVYDLHATFLDIVNETYGLESDSSSIARGRSLFQKISNRRTCRQAGIPIYYCLCNRLIRLDSDSPIVINSIDPIISHLHNLSAEFRDYCVEYKFSKILYAIKFDRFFDLDPSKEIYTIGFETIPISKFEAFFLYDSNMDVIFNESMRINPIDSNNVRGFCQSKSSQTINVKYCYCTNK